MPLLYLNFLPTSYWCSTLHIISGNLNVLITSNPNSARMLPDTTKILHLITLSYFNQTEQISHCSIFEQSYILRITKVFLVVHNDSIVTIGNGLLKFFNGMRLPSVPESILKVILIYP